jgi:FkbM family methyltransferase
MIIISPIKECCIYSKKFGRLKALKLFYFLHYKRFKEIFVMVNKERIVDTKTDCKLLVIPNDRGISLELSIFGIHEPFTTKLIARKLKEGMVCVDIGANIGYFATLESKKVGKNGKVIAIEPSPIAFSYLEKNLKVLNNSKYETYDCACFDSDTTINFGIEENYSNVSRIDDDSTLRPVSKNSKKIQISAKKLDSLLLENEIKIDFLRMDVEGYELKVLEGAKNIIKKFKPMIQFELHLDALGYENTKKILELIRDENYKISMFIIREFDMPIIGSKKDSKKDYVIEDLFFMLESNTLPRVVGLFLEYENN